MSFSSAAAVVPQNAFMNPGPAPLPPNSGGQLPYSTGATGSSSSVSSNVTPAVGPSGRRNSDDKKIVQSGWVSVKEDGSMKFMWTRKFLVLKDNVLEFNKNEVSAVCFFFPFGFSFSLWVLHAQEP